jgi:hypothetical protein
MSGSPQLQAAPRAVFPYQWMLPFGQFMICALLLWPSRGCIALQFGVRLPPAMFGSLSLQGQDAASKTVFALNLPASLLHLPYAMISPTHQSWSPRGVDSHTWIAVTAPFLGLVFWWLPGRALEALSALKYQQLTPRIGWTETIVGFVVMAIGAALMIGFLFFTTPTERTEMMPFAAAGGLWAVLGGVSVAARIAQWRMRRKAISK